MSTRINTNTTAYMASMNLNNNSDMLSTDIQRLSTGLRINSAADDAAGLVISENMMSQVSGLNQATRNSNDAINMIKTAEGALTEVQNLLVSIRQLAVHASNLGVNSAVDVAADQTQIASAISSIDRISSTTQFSNKYLLNGSASSGFTVTNGSAAVASGSQFALVSQGTWSSGNAYNYTSNMLTQASSANQTFATTTFTNGGTPATLTSVNTTFGGQISINGTAYSLANGGTATNLTSLNAIIASSGYQASINGTGNIVFTAQAAGPTTSPVIDTSQLVVSGTVSSIGGPTAASNVDTFATAAGTGGSLPHSLASVSATTNISISGAVNITDSTLGITFSKTYQPGTSINQLQTDLNATFGTGANKVTVSTGATGTLLLTGKGGDTVVDNGSTLSAFNTVTPPTSGTFTNGINANLQLSDGTHTLTSTTTTSVNGVQYYSFNNGLILSSTVAQSTSSTTSLNGSIQGTSGTTTQGSDLEFQVGANGGQTATQSIQSVAADQIGRGAPSYMDSTGATQTVLTDSVKDLNVTSFKGAQDAIAVIDKAISDISTLRANLGAFQSNVLSSNVRSLQIASTNLSASESTIRDTDLAATIVEYTKNQILVQAGTSALSYANQMPQSVLKLLQ